MSRGLSLAALLVLGTVAGWGYTINLLNQPGGVWNTGWTNGGVYGPNDAQDGNYTWTRYTDNNRDSVIASGTAYIINDSAFPFPFWRPNVDNIVAWVSTAAGPPNIGGEAWYSFFTTFTLPSTWSLWNVVLNFDVWADNQPQFVGLYSGSTLLSSVSPPMPSGSPPAGHSSAYDSSGSNPYLTLSSTSLTPGEYTIRFDVYNAPGISGNPTGLFAYFYEATATGVPEPSTYALMGTVGLALYLLRRRRKKQA